MVKTLGFHSRGRDSIHGLRTKNLDSNDNPICRTARDIDVTNRLLDSVGEGEGGTI